MYRKYFMLVCFLLLTLVGCSKKDKPKTPNSAPLSSIKLEEGSYKIVNNESEVTWVGKEFSTKTHEGTLAITDGKIDITSNGEIHGEIQINMASIDVTDMQGRGAEKLEGHLKSPDFFGVEEHPYALITFHSDQKEIKNTQIELTGDLTIKDISHPISFSAELFDMKSFIKAKADLTFDRSMYNVRFRSGKFFKDLGDKLILDDINVNVMIIAR
tara:strand:- start:280 stop:921 length:642 start_codon:yes stop_codon:yes gene_type:complete